MIKKTKDQYHKYTDVKQYMISTGYHMLSTTEIPNNTIIEKYEIWMKGLSNQYCVEVFKDGYCAIYRETHSIK